MKNNKAPNEKVVPKFVVDSYDTRINSQHPELLLAGGVMIGVMLLISFLPKECITGPPKKHDGDPH